MRINLNCPFSEKDEAKKNGARWDAARKTWYIESMEDLTPFMRWINAGVAVEKKKPDARIFTTLGALAPMVFECLPYPPWDDEPDPESIRFLRTL